MATAPTESGNTSLDNITANGSPNLSQEIASDGDRQSTSMDMTNGNLAQNGNVGKWKYKVTTYIIISSV